MDFAILGSLEIRSAGAAISITAPKLRTLTIALLLDAGHVVSADRLVDALWGEEGSAQAMVSLRAYVSRLRQRLLDPHGQPLIVTRGRGYLLDVDPTAVDAVRFEHLVRRGQKELADDDPAAAAVTLHQALSLWRGPALADVADLPFARGTAARLEELRLAAIEDRLEALLRRGQHAEVIAEAADVIAAHPLRERIRGQSMLALHRAGRTAEALAAHRSFREHLANELGLDPSPSLDELAAAILRQDPELGAPTHVAPPHPGVRSDEPRGDRPALVGRTAEQRRIREAVSQLESGRGGSLLFGGEPGIGKTALLRELAEQAHRAGGAVAWGRCHETSPMPPFWPWVQIVRSLADQMDDDTLAAATRGAAGLVAQLVPELQVRLQVGDRDLGSDPHAARFALQDAVTTFLSHVAEERRVVVIVDDLHWADLASLELAAFLGAEAADRGILLASAYRDAAAERSTELDSTLATLARSDGTATVSVTGLSAQEVGHLAEQIIGGPVDESVVAEIRQRAGGNPFFVGQLAHLRTESDHEDAEEASIPLGVRHVVLRRMSLLPEPVHETLRVASVLGQEFDARVLASCRHLELAAALEHLDVAARHGLVESVTGVASWRFLHALIRDTLYDDLAPSRAVQLHAIAGDVLEQQDPAPVQQIAEHLWLAADLVPHHRPIAWLRAATEHAMALYAYDQAEHYLRQALHLIAHDSAALPGVELAIRMRLVQVLIGLHGWSADDVNAVAERARELAAAEGTSADLTSLWWSEWANVFTRGDLVGAKPLADQLLADVTRLGAPAELVAGHIAVAYTLLFSEGPTDEVMRHLEAAATAERRTDAVALAMTPERLSAALRVTRALAYALRGDADRALAAAEDALVTAAPAGFPFSEAYTRMFGGIVAALLDRPEAARVFADDGLALCERMGLDHISALIMPTQAWAAARTGEDPGAQADRMTRAIDSLLARGHRHFVPLWLALLGEVRALAGDPDGAAAACAAGERLSVSTGEVVYGQTFGRVRGLSGRVAGSLP